MLELKANTEDNFIRRVCLRGGLNPRPLVFYFEAFLTELTWHLLVSQRLADPYFVIFKLSKAKRPLLQQ